MKKIYIYFNKIMFNFYVNFFYIVNSTSNSCSFFFFNFYRNYNISKFYFNIEANYIFFHKKNNYYFFYLNNFFCFYYYTSFNIFNYFSQIINSSRIDTIFFKNLQYVYTGKIYNIIINNFKFLLDYIDNYNYSIYISFKKYIVQTNRFLNHKLNKKIYTYKKKNINVETNINLSNNININNLSFLKIKSENLDLDKIKFRKMHFNHKI
jgi:hypothetical protein